MSESLPENWSETSIGEVVALAGDRADPAQAEGVPFLGLEHIEAHSTRILEPGDAADMKSSSPRFKAGDVLYSRLRPYLNKVCVPDFDGLCSGEIYVLRPEAGIVSDFLKFRINSFDFVDFAKHLDNGDRPRVKYDEVSQFRFGLPPSKEQQRILSVLEPTLAKIDEAEEALERVRRNLDRYRASVLKAACEGRLVPTEADLARQQARDYEPASQLLKRILIARREAWEKAQLEAYAKKGKTPPKDWKSRYPEPQAPDTSDLPELPEGWCWASIDQLVAKTNYGTSVRCDFESTGVPVLRIPNIINPALKY
jgi:type I restriction enzyme S subunit